MGLVKKVVSFSLLERLLRYFVWNKDSIEEKFKFLILFLILPVTDHHNDYRWILFICRLRRALVFFLLRILDGYFVNASFFESCSNSSIHQAFVSWLCLDLSLGTRLGFFAHFLFSVVVMAV